MGKLQWNPRNILRARPHRDRKVVQEVEGLLGGGHCVTEGVLRSPLPLHSLSSQLVSPPVPLWLSTNQLSATDMPLSNRLWPPGDVIMVPTWLPTWEQLIEEDCRWCRYSKACP